MSESSISHPNHGQVMDRLYDCAALVDAAAHLVEAIEDIHDDKAEMLGKLNYAKRVLRVAQAEIVSRANELDALDLKQAA